MGRTVLFAQVTVRPFFPDQDGEVNGYECMTDVGREMWKAIEF